MQSVVATGASFLQATQAPAEPAHVSLRGKVTFSDGNPLPTGMICFETDTWLARGDIKPDGTYVVGSLRDDDGLPAGQYRVYISGAQKAVGQDENGMDVYESLIDEKFASSGTSGLVINVTPGTKSFDVVLDRPAK